MNWGGVLGFVCMVARCRDQNGVSNYSTSCLFSNHSEVYLQKPFFPQRNLNMEPAKLILFQKYLPESPHLSESLHFCAPETDLGTHHLL